MDSESTNVFRIERESAISQLPRILATVSAIAIIFAIFYVYISKKQVVEISPVSIPRQSFPVRGKTVVVYRQGRNLPPGLIKVLMSEGSSGIEVSSKYPVVFESNRPIADILFEPHLDFDHERGDFYAIVRDSDNRVTWSGRIKRLPGKKNEHSFK